jgi:hypothetical protein
MNKKQLKAVFCHARTEPFLIWEEPAILLFRLQCFFFWFFTMLLPLTTNAILPPLFYFSIKDLPCLFIKDLYSLQNILNSLSVLNSKPIDPSSYLWYHQMKLKPGVLSCQIKAARENLQTCMDLCNVSN